MASPTPVSGDGLFQDRQDFSLVLGGPLFQFLLFRWYFRLGIWARFLWQVSRIELSLAPMHPDRVGGLGFLSNIVYAFTLLLRRDRAMDDRALTPRPRQTERVLPRLLLLLTVLAVAGCTIGPSTMTRDRFDYTAAVAESWKSQMLLNLVKLRYSDTPVFLDVGQIVSGYTVQSTFSAVGNIFSTSGVVPGVPNSSIGLGAQGQFTDRPTITYAPLMGERFARSLMTPIPPPAILSLIQAGYPIDQTLRVVVHTLNGLRNRFGGGPARRRPADPEFYELLTRLRRIQNSGAIGMRVQRTGREEATVLTLGRKVDPDIQTDIMMVRQLLGLDPQADDFRVVYGAVAADNKELAMLTRSILDILIDLSSFITVPEAHVQERRVTPTVDPEVGPGGPIPPLVRILSGTEKPGDAFVAVPYRDHWYWIDDRDLPSKSMFSFLMFMFTLVETGDKGAPPIVTIPAG